MAHYPEKGIPSEVPEGRLILAQRFHRWEPSTNLHPVPKGRLKGHTTAGSGLFQSSLRDLELVCDTFPSTEVLGYCQLPLRGREALGYCAQANEFCR